MGSSLSKEILIFVLLFIVIIFVLTILLYDFIPGKKENIKSVEYVAEEDVSSVLDEIEENTGVDVKENNSDIPLKSYTIDASDLDVYASENSYESGKSDPFSENSNPAEGTLRVTTQSVDSKDYETQLDKKNEQKDNSKNIGSTNTESIVPPVQNIVTDDKKDVKTSENNSEREKQGVFFEQKDTK